LFSCNDNFTELGESNLNSNEAIEVVPTSRIVSIEQAKTFAEKAIGAIQAKGDTVIVKNSVERSVEELIPVKSSDGEKTVLYVVNFANNHGFMILSADKETKNPVLSFDTQGKFDIKKIEKGSTVWAWLENEKADISENLQSGIHADNQGYQLWEYIIETDDGEVSVEIANIEEMDAVKPIVKGTHPESSGRSNISPWYDVKYNLWGTGRGYNANAPSSSIPIGGPAVAIGLLCKTHRYPSGYDYANMPTTVMSH
jgi:hypothetical protein